MGEELMCTQPSLADVPGGCLAGCRCPPDRRPEDGPACVEGRPPSKLREVLAEHARFAPVGNIYNEMVVATESVVAGLPQTVEGFFYLRGGPQDDARNAHRDFLRAYGLGDGKETGRSVPLLQLDFTAQDAPFSVDPQWASGRR